MEKKVKWLAGKRIWAAAAVVLVLAAASAGTVVLLNRQATARKAAAAASAGYQTSMVRRGDISRSASGTGTLQAGSTADLNFPVAGKLAQLNVQVGDQVSEGQVLAQLDGLGELKNSVESKRLALQSAQKALDDLKSGADEALAQAQLDLATAQADYADAQQNSVQQGQQRCSTDTNNAYYNTYVEYQKQAAVWEAELNSDSKYGRDFVLERLYPLQQKREQAYENWMYCSAYTQKDQINSRANLQFAKATLDQAQTILQTLKDAGGIDPVTLKMDQLKVQNAQAQLSLAEKNLAGATLSAPFDGVVSAVAASQGDEVTTATMLTVVDLNQPVIQIAVDESDLQNISVGCPTDITFDAVSGRTFKGTVTQVSPALVTVNGAAAVQGLVGMDSGSLKGEQKLPIGLTASVEVVCEHTSNALLVPVEALHTQGTSEVVYVLNDAGQPEQRTVEVGIRGVAQAEIRSGLKDGELVITKGPGIPG